MDPALLILLKLLAVAVLVVANGFFVAAEYALVRVRETQLDMLVAKGNRRARVARHVLGRLNSYLGATQLGVTLTSLGLGWVGEPVFMAVLRPVFGWMHWESEHLQHSIAFLVGFSTITFLHISVGELAPKWIAIQKPLPLTLWLAQPLRWFYLASFPASWLLNAAARWILTQIGLEPTDVSGEVHSEDELRLLLTASGDRAHRAQLGRDIVLNALDLRHRVARDVMRPRHEINVLDTEASMAECLDLAEKTRFSRFPLCEAGLVDKTLGVVHIKDLYAMRLKARCGRDLLPAARKIVYVPESARIERLLQVLLERKLHLAMVVDEYGGTMGMVTLENILEELVGQIQDEFDQEKPLLVKTGPDAWMVDGALPLRDLEELTGEKVRAMDVITVNGWAIQKLSGFPKAGDVLKLGPHELRVEEVTSHRVAQLSLRLHREPAKETQTTLFAKP
jgi:CBS domain containing-hemolysin-like protein